MLTDTQIRRLKPKDKTFKKADEKSLYLEVTTKGAKLWRFKYRFEGREKLLALGPYPDVPLKSAREGRDKLRALLAQGIDPGAERKARKAAITSKNANSFEALAREWLAKQIPTWSKSGADKTSRLFERDILPYIGKLPISDLSTQEILKTLQRIENRSADTAHRALGHCSCVFRYAIATGRIEHNPCINLKGALKPIKKRHFNAITDPQKLAQVLRMLDGYEGKLPVQCALRLAPLVFVRPGELRHAKWQDIDLENAKWSFFVGKTKSDHIVPLANQAQAILREIHPLTGRGTYVFPSDRSMNRPMSDNALLAAPEKNGNNKRRNGYPRTPSDGQNHTG